MPKEKVRQIWGDCGGDLKMKLKWELLFLGLLQYRFWCRIKQGAVNCPLRLQRPAMPTVFKGLFRGYAFIKKSAVNKHFCCDRCCSLFRIHKI